MNINLEWAASFGKPGDILLYLYQAGAVSHNVVASAVRELAGIMEKRERERENGRPENLIP